MVMLVSLLVLKIDLIASYANNSLTWANYHHFW